MSCQTSEIKNETKFLGVILDENFTLRGEWRNYARNWINFWFWCMPSEPTIIKNIYRFLTIHFLPFPPPYALWDWVLKLCLPDTDLKRVLIIRKSQSELFWIKRPREHVTSFFKIHKIMPVSILSKFCTSLKNISKWIFNVCKTKTQLQHK